MLKRIWTEQKLNGWPGLADKCNNVVKELDIVDINNTELSKADFRKQKTGVCHQLNEKKLLDSMREKRKFEKILAKGFGRKDYFNQKKA